MIMRFQNKIINIHNKIDNNTNANTIVFMLGNIIGEFRKEFDEEWRKNDK
jgi:hypothetical protein